ncbi:phosphoglucomutase-2 [Hortaea werneckii]|nr:phosphoglucomutase-2 [Hortaea werneckii]
MAAQEPIRNLAQKWLSQDRDEATREEIETLLAMHDEIELEKRLRKRIAFGTAGLRAQMKAGNAYMNSFTVLQASQGLASYIREQQGGSLGLGQRLSVVVGYDGRHQSEKFARLAAGAFIAKGLKVLWFGQLVHTPLVPFAVSHFQAAAGVMVTASHNPKDYNGYKVYWANGCQIIPPHDVGIANAIENVHFIINWDQKTGEQNPLVKPVLNEAVSGYYERLQALVTPMPEGEKAPFTYTPMHGVGLPFMQRVVKVLDLPADVMKVVEAQAHPDPEFSTVPFPNPEEHGALDLAIQEAEKTGSKIVLANDPDADRFSAAERLDDGKWHQFTGNQIGMLFASYVFETYPGEKSKLAMLASTVSSRMLAAMAKKEGFLFKETLTGFKWLGNVAQDLQKAGYDAAYAYEEAIGFMFPTVVWDKDGIAAAAVFLTARQKWQHQDGITPWQKLQQLYQAYGYFEDANTYLITPSPDVTEKVFKDIRVSGPQGGRPEAIGQRKIQRWRDLTVGYDSASAGGEEGKPDLPVDASAQMITCELDDVVFTARGSGTEPKIKLYIEGTASSSAEAKAAADEVLQDLVREWFRPEYGLKLAGS